MSDSILTTQQVARLLNVGDKTVQNYAARSIITPAFSICGRLRFKESEIKKFIESGGDLRKKIKIK